MIVLRSFSQAALRQALPLLRASAAPQAARALAAHAMGRKGGHHTREHRHKGGAVNTTSYVQVGGLRVKLCVCLEQSLRSIAQWVVMPLRVGT